MKDTNQQLEAYRNRGAVLDTNLLLLYFLGTFQKQQITSNKRLAKFSPEDFDLLIRLLSCFTVIVTTPNILTEVSNLSDGIAERVRGEYFVRFSENLSLLTEEYISSSDAIASKWGRFGLTDATIALVSRQKFLVITEDFRLSQTLQNDGIDTLNFNHIRQVSWQSRA
jgi:hypothetical protein